MARFLFALLLVSSFAAPASATDQANDSIVIGGKTYGIFQLPMNGYWRYEDEKPDDRQPIPPFETPHTANWRGYTAWFSITNGRLYLDSIKGRLGGKDVADRDILDKRFPRRANWYSGSIFVSVGGYDEMSKRFRYVIEFEIERGKIMATRYRESRRIPTTWNGQESSPEPMSSTEADN